MDPTPPDSAPPATLPADAGRPERSPRWLVWLGLLLLLVILLFAAFSLGVYVGERGLTIPTLPPWPVPPALVTPVS